MTHLFALNDGKDKSKGTFEVDYSRAVELNKEGYGIFCTLNEFEGRRKRENLKKINCDYSYFHACSDMYFL